MITCYRFKVNCSFLHVRDNLVNYRTGTTVYVEDVFYIDLEILHIKETLDVVIDKCVSNM
jgi:hypothetical protein